MKKLVDIFSLICVFCISLCAVAQPALRIGNMEITVRHHGQDTTMQITILDDEVRAPHKPAYQYYERSSAVFNLGFVLPARNNSSYSTNVVSSLNLDFGAMHRYQLSHRFSAGAQTFYSYYNYRLSNANSETDFKDFVMNGREFDRTEINKQVFRSHNLSQGVFARYYFLPPKNRCDLGIYLDAGIQGDWAFSKFYKIKTQNGQKKYRDRDAFNPLTASVFARLGWNQINRKWMGGGNNCNGGNLRAIYVRYRFTNAFNKDVLPMDLPPLTIGFVIVSDMSF